ncbi:MAG: DciA family protein [Candidatus Methylopumilus sp.]
MNKLLESEVFSSIREKNRSISSYQKLWSIKAPTKLVPLSHIGGIRDDILTVYVENSSIASKLKFIESSLLKELNEGIQKEIPYANPIKSLKIKLVVKNSKLMPPRSKSFPAQAKSAFENLLSSLEDSPLRHRLIKLIKHHANSD